MSSPVTVSMYNVGFGDCFLVRVPGESRERKILIDCGSIKQGTAGQIGNIVEEIVQDVQEDGGPRIDVVVMSHRHRDHVSGFSDPLWQDVSVDEVWLPWIEDPKDARARHILNEMASFAMALQAEVNALRVAKPFSAAEDELFTHVLDNTLTLSNEKPLATLHRGFKAPATTRRFLSRQSEPLDTDDLDFGGIDVHVLAPSTDTDVIREMNPPSEQSFLRVAAPGAVHDPDELLPFAAGTFLPGEPSAEIMTLLNDFANESAIFGAVALEKAVNNTSLMLAFEVGEAVLLFPGDSQWGSWDININDPVTSTLMKRTTFYKIGHHGSHNSTPVDFVNKVLNEPDGPSGDVWAAASVTAHGRFTEIPKLTLLDKLNEKIAAPHHVVRSDSVPTKPQWPPGLTVQRNSSNKVVRVDFAIPTT